MRKGKKHTPESNLKHSQTNKRLKVNVAEKNGNWKADKVGYNAIHTWIRLRLLKPELCQKCNIKPALDCANISGRYLRDLKDWQWLCRSCHMHIDGRMNNLKYQSSPNIYKVRDCKKITANRH